MIIGVIEHDALSVKSDQRAIGIVAWVEYDLSHKVEWDAKAGAKSEFEADCVFSAGISRQCGFLKRTCKHKKPEAFLVCQREPTCLSWGMGTPVGNRIRTLRLEKGLSLPALAEKADLSKGLLYQIETSDDANPSLETLNKIAKALGVTIALLLDKEPVRARRFVPESIEPGLEAFIRAARAGGEALNESTLQALYVLQHRAGTGAKTREDWAWLYKSIEFSFGQKAKRNGSAG